MTDYAIEIERMTIRLEEMEVKVASLEPRLFERIKIRLEKLENIKSLSIDDIDELWADLMQDFTNLNQSYQDFLKKFNEPKTEELLQSTLFISHKNSLINYLQNFIKEYITSSSDIAKIIKNIPNEDIDYLMDSLIAHQKQNPTIRQDFDYDYFKTVNKGKWNSLKKWFVGENDISEGERLLRATNNIISKITKYASSLIELHGNMINRKEEYKYLCTLFDRQTSIEDAHTLAGAVLGVDKVRHFKGISNLNSDSLIPSLEVTPTLIKVEPIKKSLRVISTKAPIQDKSKDKERILKEYEASEKLKREKLKNLVNKKTIKLTGNVYLTQEERNYILNLIAKSNNNVNKDPLFGLEYKIEKAGTPCQINSEDGTFYMDGIYIKLGGDIDG